MVRGGGEEGATRGRETHFTTFSKQTFHLFFCSDIFYNETVGLEPTENLRAEATRYKDFGEMWVFKEQRYAQIICETPSKFADKFPPSKPSFDDRFISFKNTQNVAYLISEFRLPWKAAQTICAKKGGWLAELMTPAADR